jgi:hypothetical protein
VDRKDRTIDVVSPPHPQTYQNDSADEEDRAEGRAFCTRVQSGVYIRESDQSDTSKEAKKDPNSDEHIDEDVKDHLELTSFKVFCDK